MKKRLSLLLAVMLLMSVVLTGCGGSEPAETPAEETTATEEATSETEDEALTVGFVYVGPVGDGGYTYAHNEGRLFIEEELGVNTLFKESVP